VAKGKPKRQRPEHDPAPANDAAVVQRLFASLAADDPEVVRAVLRDNPALAETVLGSEALRRTLQAVADDVWPAGPVLPAESGADDRHPAATDVSLVREGDDEPTGLLTELTRELSPQRAEELYRKVAPLLVYELLRKLDENAQVGTVQRVVDHLCSPGVQEHLRACTHVRDGILEELAEVLCRTGVCAELDRAGVQRVMERCGVMGELLTLVRCIRLMQAAG